MATPSICAIFIGKPKSIIDEHGTWISSIYRDPVAGPIEVLEGGLTGDSVAQPYHGSPDAAVCAHLLDHYTFWNTHYGMQLEPGMVGENLTLSGVTEDQICAGDIVVAGTAVLQVSGPRIPCLNLARRIGRPDWAKLTLAENRTGFYLRVLRPGTIERGNSWHPSTSENLRLQRVCRLPHRLRPGQARQIYPRCQSRRVRKKLKHKAFSHGFPPRRPLPNAKELDLDLDRHIAFYISAMQRDAEGVGLAGNISQARDQSHAET